MDPRVARMRRTGMPVEWYGPKWTSTSRVSDEAGSYQKLEYQFVSKKQAIVIRRKISSRESLSRPKVDFQQTKNALRAATSMPNLHFKVDFIHTMTLLIIIIV